MLIELEKANKFIDWLKNMLFLNAKVKTAGKRVVFRGQVYFCELGEGIGSEESKNRPCIILQNDLGNKNSNNTMHLLLMVELSLLFVLLSLIIHIVIQIILVILLF